MKTAKHTVSMNTWYLCEGTAGNGRRTSYLSSVFINNSGKTNRKQITAVPEQEGKQLNGTQMKGGFNANLQCIVMF